MFKKQQALVWKMYSDIKAAEMNHTSSLQISYQPDTIEVEINNPILNNIPTEPQPNQHQLPDSTNDAIYHGVQCDITNTKAALKRIKLILKITVVANISMFLFIMILAVVGIVLSQSTSEQFTTATNDIDLFTMNRLLAQLDLVQVQVSDLQLQLHCGPGEWRQVAYLNMSDPTHQCPSAWREYNIGGVRACGRPSAIGGTCAPAIYSISFQYRRVCGRVIGYQFGSPDGFSLGDKIQSDVYVDGISITHGTRREHIWTYAAGVTENSSSETVDTTGNCPCSGVPGTEPPSFVNNDFYCESANPDDKYRQNHLFVDDKLWDGQQCEASCCTGDNTPPWFSTNLPMTTNDAIEVRICGSQHTSDEDTPVQTLELYVQ